MMNERLQLAKQLLKEDGIIFISIDDNEQAYLKILMDEIFGEENFIAPIFWQTNTSVMKNIKYIRNDFEYILFYAKNKNKLRINKFDNQNINFINPDNDPKGPWFSSNATYSFDKENDKTFAIKTPNGKEIIKTWRFTKKEYDSGEISLYFKDDNVPRLKLYKKDYKTMKAYSNLLISNAKLLNLDENSDYINKVDSFQVANNELQSIIGINDFQTPKPVNLIKYLINLCPNKNARVLDFFAGSGTTGHAVLELNRQDEGNRTFSLITNNENNIAKDIIYERFYRINKGVGTKDENFDWTKNNLTFNSNLSVFDTKHLNIGLKNKNLVTQLLKNVQQMLEDFGVNNKIESIENILSKLRSLKPLNE